MEIQLVGLVRENSTRGFQTLINVGVDGSDAVSLWKESLCWSEFERCQLWRLVQDESIYWSSDQLLGFIVGISNLKVEADATAPCRF